MTPILIFFSWASAAADNPSTAPAVNSPKKRRADLPTGIKPSLKIVQRVLFLILAPSPITRAVPPDVKPNEQDDATAAPRHFEAVRNFPTSVRPFSSQSSDVKHRMIAVNGGRCWPHTAGRRKEKGWPSQEARASASSRGGSAPCLRHLAARSRKMSFRREPPYPPSRNLKPASASGAAWCAKRSRRSQPRDW